MYAKMSFGKMTVYSHNENSSVVNLAYTGPLPVNKNRYKPYGVFGDTLREKSTDDTAKAATLDTEN